MVGATQQDRVAEVGYHITRIAYGSHGEKGTRLGSDVSKKWKSQRHALIVDQNDGQTEMTNEDIDRLFVAEKKQ
jgi:hypothetical protein